jgi:hypothetical protein
MAYSFGMSAPGPGVALGGEGGVVMAAGGVMPGIAAAGEFEAPGCSDAPDPGVVVPVYVPGIIE